MRMNVGMIDWLLVELRPPKSFVRRLHRKSYFSRHYLTKRHLDVEDGLVFSGALSFFERTPLS